MGENDIKRPTFKSPTSRSPKSLAAFDMCPTASHAGDFDMEAWGMRSYTGDRQAIPHRKLLVTMKHYKWWDYKKIYTIYTLVQDFLYPPYDWHFCWTFMNSMDMFIQFLAMTSCYPAYTGSLSNETCFSAWLANLMSSGQIASFDWRDSPRILAISCCTCSSQPNFSAKETGRLLCFQSCPLEQNKDDSMLRSSFLQSTNFNLSTKAKANNEHHCSAHQLHVTCDPLPFSLFHLSLQVFTSRPPPVGQKPGKGHRTRASS